jgi:flagellar biosynthesis GTPase FlhF
MATESNLQSSSGVRTYRGRTLEEILPQIREELGPEAIILREREGLVGGVGGFFAQRFIEVEARRGDGQSIDIYDDGDEDNADLAPLGFEAPEREGLPVPPGEPQGAGADADQAPLEITASRQTPMAEPGRSEPRPFIPPELRRERIIPRETPAEPTRPDQPARRFETDIFLERLRAAAEILPDEDEPEAAATATESRTAQPDEIAGARAPEFEAAEPDAEEAPAPTPPARRGGPERRKPQSAPSRRPRPAGPGKSPRRAAPAAKGEPTPASAPAPAPVDPWTIAMAALVAEPDPAAAETANPYMERRQRPPSLRAGLPTEPTAPPAGRPAGPAPAAAAPSPVAPLEIRGRRSGGLRSVLARLLGGRLGGSALPSPSPAHPLNAAAAKAITAALSARGASPNWTAQLIGTAAAHGTALSEGLHAAAVAELARRIIPAPALPATGAAVAFIGAGGAGKTRCVAALASAYSRASTLGVTVIAVDNGPGARELGRLLRGDGVPVLSLNGERARQALATYRQNGLVIIDTPATTPTDPDALDALGTSLAPLALDATFITLPATLGSQAARRALAGFGRLNPSAVAITHADETDQLAVVVEIAITHRIPLAYLHAGTDHRSALSAIEASALAEQLLAP